MRTNTITKTTSEMKKKLRLPDQIDLIEEDGTIYHVRSFFVAKKAMGEVLNELSLEKIDRAKCIPAHCPVEKFIHQCYNNDKISDCYTHCISGG